jgi:hypothetical protein
VAPATGKNGVNRKESVTKRLYRYRGNEALAPQVREIGWTENVLVTLPREPRGELPTPEQVATLPEGVDE